ncbi:CEL [Bugula neritina]|uniref:CEL n=1 Tax=Bugula neritina TaxID=10212 RepID=A0A7J7J067_BUGNE|nr:CEL [Bugula neritina]
MIANFYKLGDEDCLFLNIYTPNPTGNLTVMIFIHGGGYYQGASHFYDPSVMVAQGEVVVVTINYRIGALGFMSTGDDKLPGNYGLWDQKLAIEWVKDNIKDYGGNPNSITLFGQSSGAMSVMFQMLSPANNNSLFQRALLQSGSALLSTNIIQDPKQLHQQVISSLGCKIDSELKKCLQSKSMEEIRAASWYNFIFMNNLVVIDNDFFYHDVLAILDAFTQQGDSAYTRELVGNFGSYDLFSGWNDQEGMFILGVLPLIDSSFNNVSEGFSEEMLLKALQHFPFTNQGFVSRSKSASFVNDLLMQYYANKQDSTKNHPTTASKDRLRRFTEFLGDETFVIPTIQHLKLHSAISDKNTFAYEFKQLLNRPADSLAWLRTGANHADEGLFVFGFRNNVPGFSYTHNEEEKELSDRMILHWTNFAKTGNPSPTDYMKYSHPENPSYTQLKTGSLEKRSCPYCEKEKVLSAITFALAHHKDLITNLTFATPDPIESTSTTETPCSDSLSIGKLKLTETQAIRTLQVLLAVSVIVTVLCLVLIIILIHSRRTAKGPSKRVVGEFQLEEKERLS